MSDFTQSSEGVEPSLDEVAPAEGLAETSTPEVDVNESAAEATEGENSERYTIKVAGEEKQVSLEELLNLAQKGDDYTRKTQELAEQRRQVAQLEGLMAALETDPQGTLQALQEAFGIGDPGNQEALDPEEARIRELEQFVSEQRAREQQAAIDAELSALHNTYGDFDDESLFAHALKHNIPNLEAAYVHMAKEQLIAKALADAEAAKKADTDARVEAKRAANIVEGGSTPAAGSVVSGASAQPGSVRAAFELAKQLVGG